MRAMKQMRAGTARALTVLLAVLMGGGAATGLTGCGGGYVIRGKVVESDFNAIWFVGEGDETFDEAGIPNATVSVYRDGGKPNQRLISTGRSNAAGEFEVSLEGFDSFGAGWMIEQWLVMVERPGYRTSESILELPEKKSGQRLVVFMAPGHSAPSEQTESLWDEYERYK